MHPGYEDEDDELFENDDLFEENEESEDENEDPIVREDKIFNNRYNTGEGLKDSEEYVFSSQINVSQDYSDLYLKDIYQYEAALESKICLSQIFELIEEDSELSALLKSDDPTKIKLSKDQINSTFTTLLEKYLKTKKVEDQFFSPIYILEVMSSCTNIEYKKIFDALDSENQGLLVVELNKKYPFLDGKMHKKRLH